MLPLHISFRLKSIGLSYTCDYVFGMRLPRVAGCKCNRRPALDWCEAASMIHGGISRPDMHVVAAFSAFPVDDEARLRMNIGGGWRCNKESVETERAHGNMLSPCLLLKLP